MKLIKNISKKDFARNTIITFLLMTMATIISFVLFYTPNFSPSVIAPIYILVLILIGTYTTGYLPGIIASVISVICINFLFTYPYFHRLSSYFYCDVVNLSYNKYLYDKI